MFEFDHMLMIRPTFGGSFSIELFHLPVYYFCIFYRYFILTILVELFCGQHSIHSHFHDQSIQILTNKNFI